MSDVELCPQCGGEPDEVIDLRSFAGLVRRMPIFTCHVPPPSPAALCRRAEDDWLCRQYDLAAAE